MSMGSTPKVKEDPLVKKQAEIGAKEWQRYLQDFASEEKRFASDVSEVGSSREQRYIAGMGMSALKQQSGPATPTGRPAAIVGRAQQSSSTKLPESTALGAKQRKTKGLETAVSLGRNIGTAALGNIGRQAQIATSENMARAEAKGIRDQGLYDAVGTVAGYGISQYGKPDIGEQAFNAINDDGLF